MSNATADDRRRRYRHRNSDAINARARAKRRSDPERHREHGRRYVNSPKGRAQRRRYYEENREAILARSRRRKFEARYGITEEEVEALKLQQGHRCAICREERPLCVDHCHDSGKVRGLLCDACNRGLGYFKHDAEAMQAAARYVDPAC